MTRDLECGPAQPSLFSLANWDVCFLIAVRQNTPRIEVERRKKKKKKERKKKKKSVKTIAGFASTEAAWTNLIGMSYVIINQDPLNDDMSNWL